jgi:hypothetical protein
MSNIHVGAIPKEWEGWESHFVHFHGFVSLPSEKNRPVWSPRFTCFGNEWRVILLPGGHVEAREGMISLFLWHCSDADISVTFAALVKDKQTGWVIMNRLTTHKFEGRKTWGWADFALRAAVTAPQSNVLSHGSLTVDVRIKPDEGDRCENFIPKNRFVQNMLKLFLDEDTADMSFQVQAQVFYAHKLVLKVCAKGSILTTLCDNCDESSPAPISGVDPRVFRHMLCHVYGGYISASEWKDCSKDMIEAADKYGLPNLKIEAEGWYVKHLNLAASDAVEALTYATDMNCFLLKEAAINFIIANANGVLATLSMKRTDEGEDLSRFSISCLRAELDLVEEDIDGSRDLLIARLKKGNSSRF